MSSALLVPEKLNITLAPLEGLLPRAIGGYPTRLVLRVSGQHGGPGGVSVYSFEQLLGPSFEDGGFVLPATLEYIFFDNNSRFLASTGGYPKWYGGVKEGKPYLVGFVWFHSDRAEELRTVRSRLIEGTLGDFNSELWNIASRHSFRTETIVGQSPID